MEIWANVPAVSRLVMERCGVGPGQIRAIAIANQRETAVCWRRSTGLPLYNAVTWQCARAEELTRALSTPETEERVRAVTGLRLSPYFSAAKFAWLLKNADGPAGAAAEGDLCFGTVDAWLIYRLTGGAAFKTDVSNASRTQLLDLDSLGLEPRDARALRPGAADAARGLREQQPLRVQRPRRPAAGACTDLRRTGRLSGGAAGQRLPQQGRGQAHPRHRDLRHGERRACAARR